MVKEQILPGYKIDYKNFPDSSKQWINLNQIVITPKLKNAKKFMWGFSDGTNYYINSKLYDPSGALRYSKLLYKGKKYSVFRAVTRLALPHQKSLAGLDMQNGKMFPISKSMVRELINSNKELLTEFEKNAITKNDFMAYLIRFDSYLQQLHNSR
ncbi:MAG: hypothetical protein GY816_08150 [Cytophagales bacterium]|nr:hypothetical protein [Cytophagales bacterium]